MKMENEILAPRSGVVTDLGVVSGQSISPGVSICRIVDG